MHQSKIISLLKSLSTKEMRRLDDFIQSPYFGAGEDVLRFWKVLRGLAPTFPEHKIDRFEVAQKAFPNQPLPTDNEISRIQNALLSLCESFLAIETFQSETSEMELRVLAAYERLGLDKHYQSSLRRLRRISNDSAVQNEQWHYLRYMTARIEVRNLLLRQVRSQDSNLQEVVESLDNYYFTARLRVTCEIVNRQGILSGSEGEAYLAFAHQILEQSSDSEAPAVRLYGQLLRLLVEGEDTRHFDHLRVLLHEHQSTLLPEEIREIYSYAQNYCIRRIRQGDSPFLRALFDLYQELIAGDHLLEEGILSPWKYKNITSVGLQVREFAWVEDFITRYRAHLPENFRENAFAYNMADLHYHQGDYAKALRTLGQVEFTDVFYSLDTRKMQLKIYYEQGETEPLLSLANAFRVYLRRNKLISDQNREAYANFVSLVLTLWKAQEQGKTEGLLQQIESTQPIVEEAWLRRMAEML